MRLLVLLSFVLIVSGCGSNLTNSYVDQQRNREKDMAEQLNADYAQVVGTYSGAGGRWDKIEVTVRKTDKLLDGFLVPQPRITGTFTMTPKAVTGSVAEDGGVVPVPLTDGVYDASNRKLVGSIPGLSGVQGANINCVFKDSTFNQMDCKWVPAQGSEYFEFTLTRL